MPKTDLILWDWNGTLLDDLQVSIACLNRNLQQFGYPQQYDTEGYREIFGFPIQEYYARAGFDFAKDPWPVLAEAYMQLYLPAAVHCGVTANAVTILAALKGAGYKQVILSASQRGTLIEQVSARHLEGYFDELLGLGDIYAASKVQLGSDWMAQQGIDPARAVMVGDTLHDAEVAAAMGTRCVLLASGHNSRARLETSGLPVIDSLLELPRYL